MVVLGEAGEERGMYSVGGIWGRRGGQQGQTPYYYKRWTGLGFGLETKRGGLGRLVFGLDLFLGFIIKQRVRLV